MSPKSLGLWAATSCVALTAVLTPIAAGAYAKPIKSSVAADAVHPKKWPVAKSPIGLDTAVESQITKIISEMTLEEKVGQVIQPEIRYITPEEVTQYHIGTIENGGGSWPSLDKHASVSEWVKLAETYYQAGLKGNRQGVPLIWATDAVHGHNNVFGATLFPHNIGLGAAHDPALIQKIGEATAAEVRSTGLDWAFAPTIAVARDDRWGRTYESYSEDPKIVTEYATAMVHGLQGQGNTFLDGSHVISTAKHFLGDGSTAGGRDQGYSIASEDELIGTHAPGYVAAVDAGVQSIMASYNSWHGTKMHASKPLMTDVLKGRMGFDGMIMGDWNAHGQIPGCTNADCAITLNAGLDIYNAPMDWKALHANLVREVQDGTIPAARLDDAVRRILRVKFRMGSFTQPSPAQRPGSGKPIGTPNHRAIAREAVAKSLVLLKNNGVLPVKPSATVLIAGNGADNISMQSGGWTLTWQGTENTSADFPGATSIYQGLKSQIEAEGGQALYSPDGASPTRPDVAIVVFGETPYAEFMGDKVDVALNDDQAGLALIKKFKAQGVPVVAVLLSGRPLYTNAEINSADAFVAAWLPGSEGEGVADVLLGKTDFTGRLSFSWPKRPDQTPLNVGDPGYDPQFAYGYGLSYAQPQTTPQLAETTAAVPTGETDVYFSKGQTWNGYRLVILDGEGRREDYVGTPTTVYGSAGITVLPQATSGIQIMWNGKTKAAVEIGKAGGSDLTQSNGNPKALALKLRVNTAPAGEVRLGVGSAFVPFTAALKASGKTDTQVYVPLTCFTGQDLAKTPAIFHLEAEGALDLTLSDVRLTDAPAGAPCPSN